MLWVTPPARDRSGKESVLFIGLFVLAGLMPLTSQVQFVLQMGAAYAICAIGLDVLAGYCGLPSFGQFVFVASGAYISTISMTRWDLPWPIAMIVGVAGSALLAAIIGIPIVRLQHFGFAVSTTFLGFVAVIFLDDGLVSNLTGGVNGMSVPHYEVTTQKWFYFVAAALLALAAWLTHTLIRSRTGRAFRAIKRSDIISLSMGIRPVRVRHFAFVYAAALAGLGGTLVALNVGFIVPESFNTDQSIMLFSMVAFGGIGTIAGPIVGGIGLTFVNQYFSLGNSGSTLIIAALLILSLTLVPKGIDGFVVWVWNRASALLAGRVRLPQWHSPQRVVPAAELPSRDRGTPRGDGSGLVVDDVVVAFGGVRAVDGAGFTVTRGEIGALIGPNGAGKTTMLNTISGVQPATAGSISWSGTTVTSLSAPKIRDAGIARTFQNLSLVPDLTVIDNVKLGLHDSLHGNVFGDMLDLPATRHREDVATAQANEILDVLGFRRDRREVMAKDLTLAEQKLVDIARGAVADADLLIMDEPTAGLEEAGIAGLADAIRGLRRTRPDLTMLMVAHDVGFVRGLADTVTAMDVGKVVAHDKPDAVLTDPHVVASFLGGE
ncbi:MAG TPA: ATP-binding cassette domain-containing protein [Rhodopila sp.]